MSSEQHQGESADENELRRLRHELELTRKELAAAVEARSEGCWAAGAHNE